MNNIVENITVKSKGHPLDVLKIVRDRISIQEDDEIINAIEIPENPLPTETEKTVNEIEPLRFLPV